LNPSASAFPAACGGVSERMKKHYYSLRIEDSPQFTAENFNIFFVILMQAEELSFSGMMMKQFFYSIFVEKLTGLQ
jgi:hypothetical protein